MVGLLLTLPVGAYVTGGLVASEAEMPSRRTPVVISDVPSDEASKSQQAASSEKAKLPPKTAPTAVPSLPAGDDGADGDDDGLGGAGGDDGDVAPGGGGGDDDDSDDGGDDFDDGEGEGDYDD